MVSYLSLFYVALFIMSKQFLDVVW